jgi:hypothetical protein
MPAFVQLPLRDQAAIVLIQILQDVIEGRTTKAQVEYVIGELYETLSDSFDVSEREARLVTQAVAKSGVRMLPGMPQENNDGEQVANVSSSGLGASPGPGAPILGPTGNLGGDRIGG